CEQSERAKEPVQNELFSRRRQMIEQASHRGINLDNPTRRHRPVIRPGGDATPGHGCQYQRRKSSRRDRRPLGGRK
ncbi:hypothetical protein, partial [Frankia nepalensis]|uniref:hypothetical protein n=1 Tax=Frankia nepalensis TaxID=1836974 RepID=UPI001EE485B3